MHSLPAERKRERKKKVKISGRVGLTSHVHAVVTWVSSGCYGSCFKDMWVIVQFCMRVLAVR